MSENRWQLADVERRVCDIAASQLGIPRPQITPAARLLEDLHCDSLALIELMLELEEAFDVTLADAPQCPIGKAVFIRQPFRLSDMAELIYLQQGTGTPNRRQWRQATPEKASADTVPFTQLDGRWEEAKTENRSVFEPIETQGPFLQYRRRRDGMRCISIPAAAVEIGCELPEALGDERPQHVVELDPFLIDAEPVSTSAYCRFLNSLGVLTPDLVAQWGLLDPLDKRDQHRIISYTGTHWRPVPGTEKWPMVLVSWFGANAYSLWANGRNWQNFRDESGDPSHSFLPSEAQWEYAARGAQFQPFPWGDAPPDRTRMVYGMHRRSATYQADTLPLANVNERLGMSPFELHHMAGNVWQWCRDWYDEAFYSKPAASRANSVNQVRGNIRSERGGSWVGPAELCRSSFRRGRPPGVRGRCLGFRCISSLADLS
jgi:sulfatase modifying factor 1